jgi:hypothetical protein
MISIARNAFHLSLSEGHTATLGQHPIFDPAELGECASRSRWVGDKTEAVVVAGRPGHRCLAHTKFSGRTGRRDRHFARHWSAPLDIEGAARVYRYGRLEAEQRIRNVEVVLQHQVGGAQMCAAVSQVDRRAGRCRDRPEEPTGIRVDARVKVVDLGREAYEVVPTSIEIQSDECECTVVDRSVETHIYPAHEAHVRVEEQRFRGTVRIGRSSSPLNFGHAHEAVEVVY